MSEWRVARAIEQFFDELNEAAPNRSKRSDGTIGDAAHASRTSDHNPWVVDGRGIGVVTAGDFTDDDENGADMQKVADFLLKSRDPRIKYIIHNRRIASSYPTSSTPAWTWRPYSGVNAHESHLHVSVNSEPYHYDSADEWGIAKALKPKPRKPKPKPHPVEENVPPYPYTDGRYFGPKDGPGGAVSGFEVGGNPRLARFQRRMKDRGWKIDVDGLYGPQTEAVVRAFQAEKGLVVDGLVGPKTWRAAWAAPIT